MAVSLLGAPAAWVALMSISFIAASYACYPHRAPLDAPLWDQLRPGLTTVDTLCLLVGTGCGWLAWRTWRRTRGEAKGEKARAADTGEGRTRFLGLIGIMASSLFLGAILLTCCALWLIPPCKPW